MEPEAKYTVVGVVVLVFVVLVAVTVTWLMSTGVGPNAREYLIYFEEQSLEGLMPRSYVTMRGLRVGSVVDLGFAHDRPGSIKVKIEVQPSTPVRRSTRATVERNLLTGLATLELRNKTEDSPLLLRPPEGKPYPVIAEGESTFQQVSGTLTHLAERVDKTLQRLNATLSPENREALSQALDILPRLAASYEKLGSQATISVREMNEAVNGISEDLQRLTRRAEALLSSGDEELSATAQALRSAAQSVEQAAAGLRNPREAIFGSPEGELGPGEGE